MSFRSFDDAPRGLTLGILCALIAGAFTLMGGFAAPVSAASPAIDGNVGKAMEGLKDGLKAVSKSIKDPAQNEATLKTLHTMQGHAMSAKTEKPANLEEIEEAKRAEHTAMFRADLSRLLKELCDMEIAVLEGKNEEAAALIRAKLVPTRNAGHGKYQKN
jgi:soluble cytochrome b562